MSVLEPHVIATLATRKGYVQFTKVDDDTVLVTAARYGDRVATTVEVPDYIFDALIDRAVAYRHEADLVPAPTGANA